MATAAEQQRRLTNVEAQRIMAVVEEMIVNAHFLAMVGTYLERKEELRALVGDEVVELLEKHQHLEEMYTDVWERKESARGNLLVELTDQLRSVANEVVLSTRAVCRVLRQKSRLIQQLKSHFASNRTPAFVTYMRTLNELRDVTLVRLETTVEEEKMRQEKLESIVSRERQATAEMEKLQGLVKKAVEMRAAEEARRNRTINRLTRTMENLTNATLEDSKSMAKDDTTREKQDLALFAREEAKMDEELRAANARLASLIASNKAAEEEQRRARARAESEVVNWLTRYDDEMLDKEDERESLVAALAAEEEAVAALELRHRVLKREYDAIAAEHARIEQRRQAELAEFEAMVRAAVVIQSVWRGTKARMAFRTALKKWRKRHKRRGGANQSFLSGPAEAQMRLNASMGVLPKPKAAAASLNASAASAAAAAAAAAASAAVRAAKPTLALAVDETEGTGVRITDLFEGMAGAVGGLLVGDVIYRVGDVEIADEDVFADAVAAHVPGSKVPIVIERTGPSGPEVIELTVTMGAVGFDMSALAAAP